MSPAEAATEAATVDQMPMVEVWEPTGASVIEARELFGREQIEAEAQRLLASRHDRPLIKKQAKEYHDNSRTALFEALTACGHHSQVVLHGDSPEMIHRQVVDRLLNGFSDDLPAHEKARRFEELCEELITYRRDQMVADGSLPTHTEVGIFSDVPTVLIKDMGYRYANGKGMVRTSKFVALNEGGYARVIEQVSRSNSSGRTSNGFLTFCGLSADPSDQRPSDIIGLSRPFLYSAEDFTDGIVDIVRVTDQLDGPGVRYGEPAASPSKLPDYAELRTESSRREAEAERFIDRLARLEADLDLRLLAGELPPAEAQAIYQGEVERILAAICTLHPDYTADTFGNQSVESFVQASQLVAAGQLAQAQRLLEHTRYLRNEVTFCGVTISIDEAKEKGLPVNDYNELINEGKEGWEWKLGQCVVKQCPSRPSKTLVGPCSVCKKCQAQFDAGKDPTKTRYYKE